MEDSINKRIARCRKLANLTQNETAEKLGIKGSTYSQMERKGGITVDKVFALAEIFRVHPDILFYGEEPTETVNNNNNIDFSANYVPKKLTLMQNNTAFAVDSSSFTYTKKEENIFKIIHNLPKAVKDDVIAYIEQKYKETK